MIIEWTQPDVLAMAVRDGNAMHTQMIRQTIDGQEYIIVTTIKIHRVEHRPAVSVRLSADEAREIVDFDTVPVDVKNRIRYQMWRKKE